MLPDWLCNCIDPQANNIGNDNGVCRANDNEKVRLVLRRQRTRVLVRGAGNPEVYGKFHGKYHCNAATHVNDNGNVLGVHYSFQC